MKTKKGNLKRIIANAVYGIVLLFIAVIIIILAVARSQNRVSFLFDHALVWIMSPSMEDTIPAKSYILIKKSDGSDIEKNDINMFYSDDPSLSGMPNTHRVVEVIGENNSFVTRGDNNLSNDKYEVKAEKVIGKHVKNLQVLSAVMRVFLSKIGIIILIASILLITLAIYLPRAIKKQKENTKENKTQ